MGLFDEVKQNVTVRQAAERYGLKPNRSGLIRCIFHNDKSPSMKVDRRYYCFGCGCTGDAIDFTAQLFDIGLKDAAMKLADDFGIPYSGRDRGSPQNRRSVSAKKPEPTPEELWQKKHLRCLRAYLDYLSLLLEWKEQYAPKTRTEECMDVKGLREEYARCETGDGYFYDIEADKLMKMKFIRQDKWR